MPNSHDLGNEESCTHIKTPGTEIDPKFGFPRLTEATCTRISLSNPSVSHDYTVVGAAQESSLRLRHQLAYMT